MIGTVVLPILVIAFLIVMNGLFVAAEFAIVGASRSRVEGFEKDGNRTARYVRRVLENPTSLDRYIAISQLGITLATIGLGMYGEPAIAGWLYDPIEARLGISTALAHTIGTIVAVSVMTYFHVVVGEMIPKALALQTPEKTAIRVSPAMRVVGLIFRPAVLLLNWVAVLLLRLLGIPVAGDAAGRFYSPKELESLVEESSEGGTLDRDQRYLIANIFDFGEREVRQVMTPRPKVVGIPADSAPDEVEEIFRKSRHTRFPVFEGDLDRIVGILHVKDFMKWRLRNSNGSSPEFRLEHLLRRAPRLPESTSAERALASFKNLRVQMAVALEEHGGTAGIVTLEDLIEEVVGEVRDEFDSGESEIQTLDDGSVLADAQVLLQQINERYETNLASGEFDTLAGLMIQRLGRPPKEGDVVEADGTRLEAAEVEGLAISQVRIIFPDRENETPS